MSADSTRRDPYASHLKIDQVANQIIQDVVSATPQAELDKLAFEALMQSPRYRAADERRLTVSAAMLRAGRAAFKRQRAVLDDLYDFFPCDLNEFLTHIYREMARAADIP